MAIALSAKQQEIVNFNGKNMLVIAGAGSGKTRVMTERIKRLVSLSKHGQKVLAITFSNKAANELRDRLRAIYDEDKLSECIYVGTVHGFCLDLITSRGHSIGLSNNMHIFESFDDRLQIFKEAIENVPEFKQKYLTPFSEEAEKKVKELLNNLSNAKRQLKMPNDYTNKPLTQTLYNEYNNLLLLQGAIDFDDILLYAYQILTERESITKLYRKIYKHICVDEAQDLNRAQYEVIKALAGDEINIMMVGDPNQSIYGFNGSTSDYIDKIYLEDFKPTKFVLNENYRSSKKVIEAANIIEPSFKVQGVCPLDGEFSIHDFANEADEAAWVLDNLQRLLKDGHSDIENKKITLEQCAILARNRYVFKEVERLLKSSKLKYNLRVSANNSIESESDFIKVFELGTRLLTNPKDRIHFGKLLNIIKMSDDNIISFDDVRKMTFSDNGLVANFVFLNKAWDLLNDSDGSLNFNKALDVLKKFVLDELNHLSDDERNLAYSDIVTWEGHWKAYIKQSAMGERTLSNFRRSISLGTTQKMQEEGITLTTVHMSKGLEFDVTFIIGMNEGVFPDYRALNNDEQLSEERHNAFVAITRSKRLCYMTYPKEKTMPWGAVKKQKPSRYIIEIVDKGVTAG